MRVLIACEFSGRVRSEFAALGHDAWSCDLRETEIAGNHIVGDVRDILNNNWDLMISHPPCQYLSYAGARWFKTQPDRMERAKEAFGFFMEMVNAPIPLICVENSRGLPLKWYRRSDQVIHPWMFGEAATKETHLWLKGLPPLLYTSIHTNPVVNWVKNKAGGHTGKDRSRTFPGIAKAMAHQWGSYGA